VPVTSSANSCIVKGGTKLSFSCCHKYRVHHGNPAVQGRAKIHTVIHVSPGFSSVPLLVSLPVRICHAVVSFVTLRSQMEASIPSLLHAIRQNLEANLDMLGVLSHTWPIASMLREFFRTMTGPEQFERMLSTAAEKCGKRARGEDDDSSTPLRSSTRFKRPKLQQVVLPQTRVVLQILQRETQKQFDSQGPLHDKLNTRVESMPSGVLTDQNRSTPMTDVDPLFDDCDASAILRSLRRIIDAGNSITNGSRSDKVS
jgi:hypothetical protein